MKFFPLLLAAGLCSFTAASAQTTPTQTTPAPAEGARGTTTASPDAVPSGTAPVQADPTGAVTPSEVFTKGAPTNGSNSDRRMKRQRTKGMKADGKMKMKDKM